MGILFIFNEPFEEITTILIDPICWLEPTSQVFESDLLKSLKDLILLLLNVEVASRLNEDFTTKLFLRIIHNSELKAIIRTTPDRKTCACTWLQNPESFTQLKSIIWHDHQAQVRYVAVEVRIWKRKPHIVSSASKNHSFVRVSTWRSHG